MTIASEWVSDLVEGDDMRAYVSRPETIAQVPGVSVITPACGVNQYIQGVTDRLSRAGDVVVARHYITAWVLISSCATPVKMSRHREMPGSVHVAHGVRVPVA
jgi:dienelactone hydrolase